MKVFIDGKSGTTGLRIYERMQARSDVEILTLPEEERHDPAKRKQALNACDAAFLCLPDAAAREAADMVENPNVTVFDTSTAHRTAPGWAYGFPELSARHRSAVETSRRVAVPGCHASGFTALVFPLVEAGLLSADVLLTCFSVTGYSGGGKKMIAEYEATDRPTALDAPRQYGVSQAHKHLPEMKTVCGLRHEPVFCPIVADFYSGMVVTVPVFASQLAGGASAARECFRRKYCGPLVQFKDAFDEGGFVAGNGMSGRDVMEVTVAGNDERVLLMARFDNLGKGASGAAIQCLNLNRGLDETYGLAL